ncbi:MAG: hypothetical protein IJV69_02520, partial [Kiritimatiellae bacterium]|nr:hypothetical protein [Kiritimatiellia bacterium]
MMKKAFLFALAALCVSAAHAVTVKWSGTSMGGYTYGVGSANASCSLVIAKTFATDPGTGTLAQIIDHNGTGNKYDFRTNGGNVFVSLNSANTALGESKSIQTNLTYIFAINVIAKGDSDYTFDFFINGDKVYTTDFNDMNEVRFWSGASDETFLYNGALTDSEIAALAAAKTANIASVPEPT